LAKRLKKLNSKDKIALKNKCLWRKKSEET